MATGRHTTQFHEKKVKENEKFLTKKRMVLESQ